MKVAYILPYLSKPCGWRTLSIGAVQALKEYVQPVLCVAVAEKEIARHLFPDLPVISLPVTQQFSFSSLRGAWYLAQCNWTIRQFRSFDVDLVHSMEIYPSGLVGWWLAKHICRPLVATANGTYAVVWQDRVPDRWIYRKVLRSTSLIHPISNGTATEMWKYFSNDINSSQVKPIVIGNDYYRAIPRQEAIRKRMPDIPTFLTVGDVKPRKGQLTSLLAFAQVKKIFPQARYWIVGDFQDNAYTRQLKTVIKEEEIRDVSLLGLITEQALRERYQQASIFVLTPQSGTGIERYHLEGFGLVYLEAGAYGMPVIGSRFGGVPDAIRDGETGLLVSPGDVEGLTQAMVKLLEQPEMALKIGAANRTWAETLTWQRYAQEQYQAYQAVITSS